MREDSEYVRKDEERIDTLRGNAKPHRVILRREGRNNVLQQKEAMTKLVVETVCRRVPSGDDVSAEA